MALGPTQPNCCGRAANTHAVAGRHIWHGPCGLVRLGTEGDRLNPS